VRNGGGKTRSRWVREVLLELPATPSSLLSAEVSAGTNHTLSAYIASDTPRSYRCFLASIINEDFER